MARPRTGADLRRTVTLSLSPETIAILDALGPNRSRAAERLLLRTTPLSESHQETTRNPTRKPPDPVNKQETIAQLRATLDTQRANCTHQWTNKGHGTYCDHCGTRKTP